MEQVQELLEEQVLTLPVVAVVQETVELLVLVLTLLVTEETVRHSLELCTLEAAVLEVDLEAITLI
jgi:hypothetical protein